MSVRFSADSIVHPSSTKSGNAMHPTAMMDFGQSSMSSNVEAQALMDTQHHHQGRLGTPDANNTASYMSSDYNNNNQQQQQQEHLKSTSQPATVGASALDLFAHLHEALALEPKYQPNLFLPLQSNVSSLFSFFLLAKSCLMSMTRYRTASISWLPRPRCHYSFKRRLYLISDSFGSLHSLQDGEITIGTRDGAAHVLRCLKVWYDLPHDVLFTAINLVDRFLTKMKVRPKHMACISVGSLILAVKQLGLLPIDTDDLVAISQVSFRFFVVRALAPGGDEHRKKRKGKQHLPNVIADVKWNFPIIFLARAMS